MYAHGFFLFFRFVLLSLSLSSFFFCLFLRISYAGPFEPRLVDVVGAALRRYNGKPKFILFENLTMFFLLQKPFAPFLYMLESSCLCYYYMYLAYYRIKWY